MCRGNTSDGVQGVHDGPGHRQDNEELVLCVVQSEKGFVLGMGRWT